MIIPEENHKDLADIPKAVTQGMKIVPVRWIDEVLDIALERPLTPRRAPAAAVPAAASRASQRRSRTSSTEPACACRRVETRWKPASRWLSVLRRQNAAGITTATAMRVSARCGNVDRDRVAAHAGCPVHHNAVIDPHRESKQ